MPGSASPTTPGWNAATPAARPTPSSMPSPGRCGLTTPNVPTCSTWSALPTPAGPAPPPRAHRAARPGSRCARSCGSCWRRWIGVPAYIRNGRLDLLAGNALGPRPVRADLRQPGPAGQRGPLHLSRPGGRRVLPRLGRGRRPERRQPARRGRPQPLRQGPVRPDRRAVHPRRHLPPALGQARGAPAQHRRQANQPPGRRPADLQLRGHGAGCRRGPCPHRVQRPPGSRDADALSLLASWSAADRTRQSATPG